MTVSSVVGGLGAGHVHLGGQPEDRRAGGVAGHEDDVVTVGGVDDDRVRLAITAATGRQVGVDLGHVGAAQVVDDDGVGAAEGVEVDDLDVVEIHRHVGDVAEEQHPPAVGGDVDVLGGVGAVEQHRVGAGLALERVVVVARVPDEGVVTGAHQRHIVAVAAVDQVVALAAEERVVAEAAVHRQLDAVGSQRGGVDGVVAAKGVERQPVVGLLLVEDA